MTVLTAWVIALLDALALLKLTALLCPTLSVPGKLILFLILMLNAFGCLHLFRNEKEDDNFKNDLFLTEPEDEWYDS